MPGKTIHEEGIANILLDNDKIELLYLGVLGKKLNANLKLHDHKILASMINPLTGQNMKLSRDFSYILPSPKIRFDSVANTSTHPRFLATTGALTHGNYKDGSNGSSNTAQGRKAALEHEYGFTFVEVLNNRRFNSYPIAAGKNGNFNHLREFYKNGKVYDQQPEALVLGDWHTGDTCPKTRKKTITMIEELKPKRVFFHDLFNAHSINHHERSNHLSKARLWQEKMHVLQEEVEICLKELNFFAKKFPDIEFLVVESNHDLFMARYIGIENFLEDGQNSVFSCKLFADMSENPEAVCLELAMRLVGNIAKNVKFLDADDDYRIRGVGLGLHGHKGVNGARGSSRSYSNYNLRLITGHEHSPKIHPKGMVVGTSTHLSLGYTKGSPGSWLNAHGLLYSSGKYTLLTLIK